jgi:hypothetical protein
MRRRFPKEDWGNAEKEVKNPKLWDKGWDDDSVNDPLGQQLRAALPAVMQQPQE